MTVLEFVDTIIDLEDNYDVWFQVNDKIVICVASTSAFASPFVSKNLEMVSDIVVHETLEVGNGLYMISDEHIDNRLLKKCVHNHL